MKIPKENCYICDKCKHINVIVYVAEGTTPFMIPCEKCNNLAMSTFYPKFKRPSYIQAPTREFYKPVSEEYEKLTDDEKKYVNNGGLLLRKRTNFKPVYHNDKGLEEMLNEKKN